MADQSTQPRPVTGQSSPASPRPTLSVAIIACNEEANLPCTLASVAAVADEIILVDSGSTDRTLEIARSYGERVRIFQESWKGFARQKNSALDKAGCDWVLLLDADESLSPELAEEIAALLARTPRFNAYWLARKNFIFGRWIRHGGFYPDRKLRLFRRGAARLPDDVAVHETPYTAEPTSQLRHALIHRQYPTLELYIEHMNRYSSAGAAMALQRGRSLRSLPAFLTQVVLNPGATFVKNYFFRLGFLDGREGLLLHLYHSAYVSWKYAKLWEQSRRPPLE